MRFKRLMPPQELMAISQNSDYMLVVPSSLRILKTLKLRGKMKFSTPSCHKTSRWVSKFLDSNHDSIMQFTLKYSNKMNDEFLLTKINLERC
jgi:hypothetical protein